MSDRAYRQARKSMLIFHLVFFLPSFKRVSPAAKKILPHQQYQCCDLGKNGHYESLGSPLLEYENLAPDQNETTLRAAIWKPVASFNQLA